MIYKKLYLLPLLVCFGFVAEFAIFYLVALFFGHVHPLMPFISETGTHLPESCYFAEILGATAYLLALLTYVRYIQVRDLVESDLVTKRENVAALIFGWLSAFGVSIVASFQMTNLPEIHLGGSIFAFGCGSIYQLIMWKISLSLKDVIPIPNWLHPIKLILAITSFCTFVTMYTLIGVADFYYHGDYVSIWTEADGGYDYHLGSTTAEWICAISTSVYIATLAADFKYFKLEEAKITRIENV